MSRKLVFAGKTPEGEKISLYVEAPNEKDFVLSQPTKRLPPREAYFIKRPDGETWALSPQAKIFLWENEGEPYTTRIKIESPEWTGTAKGTRVDLTRAERLDQ